MKKISLFAIFIVVAALLFAQTANEIDEDSVTDEFLALQAANLLVKYGYRIQSASALIGAAEIFAQMQAQPMPILDPSTGDARELTPAILITDAKRIAGRDRTMNAWADDVQKTINTNTRGSGMMCRVCNGMGIRFCMTCRGTGVYGNAIHSTCRGTGNLGICTNCRGRGRI